MKIQTFQFQLTSSSESLKSKTCSDCGQTKEIDCFYYNYIYCKNCHRKRGRKWYLENIEKVKEYNKKYYQENKDRIKPQTKQWAGNHRERVRKMQAELYKKNKEAYKAKAAEWAKNNPDKRRLSVNKYSQKERENLSDNYVKNLILGKGGTLKQKDIPQELVEFKREQIKLIRTLKQGVCNGSD